MGSTNRLKQGLAILRAIARSDAVRDVRERLREGAIAVAESDRLPRLVSAGAGIMAALLDEPAEVDGRPDAGRAGVDSWAVGEAEEREPTPADASDSGLDEDLRDDLESGDFEPDEAASLRDLQDAEGIEDQLLGVTDTERDDEDDGEARLLRFDAPEADAELPSSPEQEPDAQGQRAQGNKPRKTAKAEAGSARGKASKSKTPARKKAKASKGASTKPAAKRPRERRAPRTAAEDSSVQGGAVPARRVQRKK